MKRSITGIVMSTKGNKTITVRVETRTAHPVYRKQYTHSNSFMAHDEKNEAKVGDSVIITESRPISRHKYYTLDKIISRAELTQQDLKEPTE